MGMAIEFGRLYSLILRRISTENYKVLRILSKYTTIYNNWVDCVCGYEDKLGKCYMDK